MLTPRFAAVRDGVFRSPLPLAREIAEFAGVGGRSVLDLTRRPRPVVERACSRHGIEYSKFGLPYDFTAAAVDEAVVMLLALPRPVLVHCFHGRDRTGAVIARFEALC